MSLLKVAGGRIVDPANGVDDSVGDLWISGDRIVPPPADPAARPSRTIDARGLVVMPGGVDVHSHIVGSKVNAARALRPEERREIVGSRKVDFGEIVPFPSCSDSLVTGRAYAGLGYTTAVDAAIVPMAARQAHLELARTPIIDAAILLLMGNNHVAMDRIRAGDDAGLADYVAWVLGAAGGFGIKVVNPGGVERWKRGHGEPASLDGEVDGFGVTPRQILSALAGAVDGLGLPHPIHVHGLNLGLPGNAAITRETMEALDGRRAHLAHVQFHSYGGSPTDTGRFDSRVPELAEFVNGHPGLTVDVGQVMFGETTSMTADSAVGYYLHRVTGRKWVGHDVEQETGCGIVPIRYEERNFVHALQFAIGLEWFLRVDDPWRVALSTDHPNGASFLTYPRLIALLMDRGHRSDVLARLPDRVRARSGLADLTREYSLAEVAIVTRAGPARILGLADRGHLGAGARADVAIYAPGDDKERMFSLPRYVLKGGAVVLDGGEPVAADAPGATLTVAPGFDPAIEGVVSAWFDRYASIRFRNYALGPGEAPNRVVVPGRSGAR